MADIAKIIQGRTLKRASAASIGPDHSKALELKYIADSLEALRTDSGSIAHLFGTYVTRPK